MAISKSETLSIAHLARLSIAEEELPAYSEELSKILDLVEVMSAVDSMGVVPMAHPHHAVQRLRDDVVTESNNRDNYQQQAPATEDGLYLVPRVLE